MSTLRGTRRGRTKRRGAKRHQVTQSDAKASRVSAAAPAKQISRTFSICYSGRGSISPECIPLGGRQARRQARRQAQALYSAEKLPNIFAASHFPSSQRHHPATHTFPHFSFSAEKGGPSRGRLTDCPFMRLFPYVTESIFTTTDLRLIPEVLTKNNSLILTPKSVTDFFSFENKSTQAVNFD